MTTIEEAKEMRWCRLLVVQQASCWVVAYYVIFVDKCRGHEIEEPVHGHGRPQLHESLEHEPWDLDVPRDVSSMQVCTLARNISRFASDEASGHIKWQSHIDDCGCECTHKNSII
jgi:hypothetical protein